MNIAFCYEQVIPARGGCETYITDLSRRLLSEGNQVHLYACRWDESAMPKGVVYHRLPEVRGLRFLRPWRFGKQCLDALAGANHDVTVGFNKTWGQDVLYPQGGLHAASADCNLDKFTTHWQKQFVSLSKLWNPTQISYRKLEKQQYLSTPRPIVVVNSYMVRKHFQDYLGMAPADLFVVRSAVDPMRFCEQDRPRRRLEQRQKWGLLANHTIGLFAAINYRLKGLDPLLRAVKLLDDIPEFRRSASRFKLVVAGHPNYGRYERLAAKLGIDEKVQFVGHCAEMRNAYFAADFLVHPTFYDPCSLVVLEAFACSLPVITTRSNGASELMHPFREGYVIDSPHNHDRLAWSITQLLDADRRNNCAKFAREAALRWTFDHHYKALLQVFQQAAARKRAA